MRTRRATRIEDRSGIDVVVEEGVAVKAGSVVGKGERITSTR